MLRHRIALILWLILPVSPYLRAQDTTAQDVVQMEPFNVTVYRGDIPIIDGFTGKAYTGSNEVVVQFAKTFNKLLLGYHKKLVIDEVRHLNLRYKLGKEFEREMGTLSASFGFGEFALDDSTWLRRERAIVTRLIREPFFKVKALVVWDRDRLQKIAPKKPDSKYAADLRYDPDTGSWQRRILTRWEVFFYNNPNRTDRAFETEKIQGLNLDTQRGFHFIERGLPVQIPSSAFQEVKLTYPIFYSDHEVGEKILRHLQETLVANLYYLYDPFSWMARRDTRFRGGYIQDCQEHVRAQRIYVEDRDAFDATLSRFLSDVVTIKLQGADEIYSLHMLQKHLGESPRTLGVGLDLLNWNKGEERDAIDRPATEARISPSHPGGFRFVMIDAYQRLGEPFLEKIRSRLREQKELRRSVNGQTLLTEIIAELSGLPYSEFAQRAKHTQEAHLARHKMK